MQTIVAVKDRLGIAPACAAMGLALSSYYQQLRPRPARLALLLGRSVVGSLMVQVERLAGADAAIPPALRQQEWKKVSKKSPSSIKIH